MDMNVQVGLSERHLKTNEWSIIVADCETYQLALRTVYYCADAMFVPDMLLS